MQFFQCRNLNEAEADTSEEHENHTAGQLEQQRVADKELVQDTGTKSGNHKNAAYSEYERNRKRQCFSSGIYNISFCVFFPCIPGQIADIQRHERKYAG